jgi:hypothetical protein
MMSVEERLAHVEGLVGGQAQLLGDLRAAVTTFEDRVDRRFEQIETRFNQVDGRFTNMEGRLTALDQKFDARCDVLDAKLDTLDQRWTTKIDAVGERLDSKIDGLGDSLRRDMATQFRWTMGLMVTLVTVVLGAVLAR